MSKHNIMILGPTPSALEREEYVDMFDYSTPTRAFDAYIEYTQRFDVAYKYVSLFLSHEAFRVVVKKEYYVEAAKA